VQTLNRYSSYIKAHKRELDRSTYRELKHKTYELKRCISKCKLDKLDTKIINKLSDITTSIKNTYRF
jgi:molecular chaperone DnaK